MRNPSSTQSRNLNGFMKPVVTSDRATTGAKKRKSCTDYPKSKYAHVSWSSRHSKWMYRVTDPVTKTSKCGNCSSELEAARSSDVHVRRLLRDNPSLRTSSKLKLNFPGMVNNPDSSSSDTEDDDNDDNNNDDNDNDNDNDDNDNDNDNDNDSDNDNDNDDSETTEEPQLPVTAKESRPAVVVAPARAATTRLPQKKMRVSAKPDPPVPVSDVSDDCEPADDAADAPPEVNTKIET